MLTNPCLCHGPTPPALAGLSVTFDSGAFFLLAANSYSPRTICFHMLSLWHGCYFFAICKHSEGFPCLFFARRGWSFTAPGENWHEGAAAPQASGAFSPCALLLSVFSSHKSSSAPVSTPPGTQQENAFLVPETQHCHPAWAYFRVQQSLCSVKHLFFISPLPTAVFSDFKKPLSISSQLLIYDF